MMVPEALALSAVLFTIGVIGVLVRRNALVIFMSIELMLTAANLAFVTFSWLTVRIEAMLLPHPPAFAVACALLAACLVWLLMRRAELWREDPALLFHDGQAPAVQTLDLSQ